MTAFFTVATVLPLASSMTMVSRTRAMRSWILNNSLPCASSNFRVCPHTQRLAVNLVGTVAVVVLNPEVIPDRPQLLAHRVEGVAGVLGPALMHPIA